jgi:pseudaminic acid synthase
MKESGADAVKLQTYTPDTITLNCDNDYFRIKQGTVWDGRGLYELYAEAMTPWEWHEELFGLARSLGMEVFSSPFDKSAVDFLEELNPYAYKIASFEITDTPLIEYAAAKKRPMIISTGVAELADIELAVETCKKVGNNDITLLKCTSSYPAPLEEMNLATIADMKSRFGCKVGLSDHSMSIAAPVVAVALGAEVIEKHFILDRKMGGADSSFSLEPHEFADMVRTVRDAQKLIGKITYELSEKSKKSREFARSLFVSEDIEAGGELTAQNIRSVRPGFGLHPKHFGDILGKTAVRNLKKGEPLTWDMIR